MELQKEKASAIIASNIAWHSLSISSSVESLPLISDKMRSKNVLRKCTMSSISVFRVRIEQAICWTDFFTSTYGIIVSAQEGFEKDIFSLVSSAKLEFPPFPKPKAFTRVFNTMPS